jgi:hypothetical protein
VLLYGRVRIYFKVDRSRRWMPLIAAGLLTATFLWIAENVGTATGTWLYPGNRGWIVSLQKLGSWYLLLNISFFLVTIVNRPKPLDRGAGAASFGAGRHDPDEEALRIELALDRMRRRPFRRNPPLH